MITVLIILVALLLVWTVVLTIRLKNVKNGIIDQQSEFIELDNKMREYGMHFGGILNSAKAFTEKHLRESSDIAKNNTIIDIHKKLAEHELRLLDTTKYISKSEEAIKAVQKYYMTDFKKECLTKAISAAQYRSDILGFSEQIEDYLLSKKK